MANKSESAEVAVRSVPPDLDEKHVGSDPQSNLPTMKVSASDMPKAEPLHKLAAQSEGVFDPNAALRNLRGVGPGLQDSEAKNPAVWVDLDSDEARKSAADAIMAEADRAHARAKAEADAVRKGEPF